MFSGEESYWPESWTGDVNDGYDIAVVRLNEKANLTVPSIDSQEGEFPVGKLFTALGWGLDKDGEHPNSLQMADKLLYTEHEECEELFEVDIKEHSICAGRLTENTCKGVILVSITLCQASSVEGDSGGPLLIPNRFGGSIAAGNPKFDLVVGVTSMGSKDCKDTRLPSIYTSIGAFWDWIQEKIDEDLEVKCIQHLLFAFDRLAQEKHPRNLVEPPSPDDDEGTRTPQTERPIRKETRKEQSEKRKIEKERKRLTGLSQKELIEVTLTMQKITVNAQTVL